MNYSKYYKQGFQGVDVSLEISLEDYGLIWKEFKYNLKKRGVKKGEILAIYCLIGDVRPLQTSYGYFTKKDLLSADWIEWNKVSDYCGCSVDELQRQSTGRLLFDLISYYGGAEFGFMA